MRVALCLSGQPRTWRHCVDSLRRFVAGHEVTTFLHLWDEVPEAERAEMLAAYQPAAHLVTARPPFAAEKRRMAERWHYRPPFSIFDMFHAVQLCLNLALGHKGPDGKAAPFDAIVRVRYDSRFEDTLPEDWFRTPGLITPDSWTPADGYNDQFAFGRPAFMRLYAAFATWLPRGMEGHDRAVFQPEAVLRQYLDKVAMVPVRQAPLRVTLLREGQEDLPFDKLTDLPMVHARKAAAWKQYAEAGLPADLAEKLDFSHYAEAPLVVDQQLTDLLEPMDQAARHALLRAPWEERILAVDAFLAGQVSQRSGNGTLTGEEYERLRLLCAGLIYRMPPEGTMDADSAILHVLSCNVVDATRVADWLKVVGDPGRAAFQRRLGRLTILAAAITHADPFEQDFRLGWRLN
ncbi:hypothetical protein FBZ89_110125 [Nitrospirillum amazonense]|uniref:Uncharacterized protein n=1 Tax=Nitrospirillum amazonense TaxID=28077 RepID=A0A560FA50_9PROT|nr:hypothetical protein [Nitrospirillum amazonense]TWB18476.1 hypothetical protein FBZ89_110125 [Nitrospirillum amazonense]